MNTLPTDIYINIFKYLPRDFVKISKLSKYFNVIYKSIKVDVAHLILIQTFNRMPYKASFAVYEFSYIKYYRNHSFDINSLGLRHLNDVYNLSDKNYIKTVFTVLWFDIIDMIETSISMHYFELYKHLLKSIPLKYIKIHFDSMLIYYSNYGHRGYYETFIALLEYIVSDNRIDINVNDLIRTILLRSPDSTWEVFNYYWNHDKIANIIKLLAKYKHGINSQRKLLKKYANANNNIQLIEFLNEI